MTEELKKEILDILDNVYYWETCPQEYNDRIDVVKKQLHIPVVVQQSELLKCDQVCDWISIGYAGNGHDECKTCGKTRAFS